MNIIEKLGIEKCREIVAGAPGGASYFCKIDVDIFYLKLIDGDLYKSIHNNGCKFFIDTKEYEIFELSELKQAIEKHDSEQGDAGTKKSRFSFSTKQACGLGDSMMGHYAEQAEMINYSPNVRVFK